MGMAVLLLTLAVAACGGPECDVCPDALKAERSTVQTQLGPQPVTQCTARNGWVLSIPVGAECHQDYQDAWRRLNR